MRALLIAVVLSLSPLLQAHARHFEIGAGMVDEIDGESSHTFTVSWFPRDGNWPIEVLAGHIAGRDNPAALITPNVNFVAVSLRRQWSHWFVGFGVAAIDGQSDALSSTHQFVSTGGYRFNERFSLVLRHMSNANTRGANRGENLLTLNVQF